MLLKTINLWRTNYYLRTNSEYSGKYQLSYEYNSLWYSQNVQIPNSTQCVRIFDKLVFENDFYVSKKYHLKFQKRNNFLISQSKFDLHSKWEAKVKSKLCFKERHMSEQYEFNDLTTMKDIANNLCCSIGSRGSQSETDFTDTPY